MYLFFELTLFKKRYSIRNLKFIGLIKAIKLPTIKSFLDYMYTVCELGFLEGLIPVLDVGFLSPIEYKRLSEVCAVVKVSMDSVDPSKVDKIYPQSPGKKMDMRLKNIAWAMEAGIPVSAGILVSIGETEANRRTQLNQIAQLQKKYGLISCLL